MELKELLAKWAEVEPERCLNLKGQGLVRKGCFGVAWDGGWYRIDIKSLEPEDLAIIEYVIRMAIAARGWHWKLISSPDCRIVTGVVLNELTFDSFSHESAIALLAAYLNALGVK